MTEQERVDALLKCHADERAFWPDFWKRWIGHETDETGFLREDFIAERDAATERFEKRRNSIGQSH